MALKNDRDEQQQDITFFMNEVAERGGIVVISTAGSGAALDQSQALVTYDATPTGSVPVGLLLNDMVNDDLTQTHGNFYKNETQVGDKVTLLTQGWVVTNMIYPGVTPTAGQVAYLEHSGLMSTTSLGNAATPPVGRFLSTKDEDGYAKVYVRLPNF